MGGAIPGQVILGWVGKEAEQAMENKLVSSSPPWYSEVALTAFDDNLYPESRISPFFSYIGLDKCFIIATKSELGPWDELVL